MVDEADDLPMHSLVQRPFHVINAARKTLGDIATTPFRRTTESFTFTPLQCGTASLGFRPTASFGGSVSLGTAIAASAAAISPNLTEQRGVYMGLLRVMLNPKLGVWLANPASRGWKSKRAPFALSILLKEVLGAGKANDNYLYISDGGHFENLGLYEMVRRRCKNIIVVDATRDENYTYSDLANAIARIRSDLKVASFRGGRH